MMVLSFQFVLKLMSDKLWDTIMFRAIKSLIGWIESENFKAKGES